MPISSLAQERAAILDTALLQALFLTGQSLAALELLKGLNYCDLKICEEFLQKGNFHSALVELYKSNNMHREALGLLHHLVEESKSEQPQVTLTQKFTPNMIIDYLKPLCGTTDPMLVLEFSMLVLESCPTGTIDLFLSGNILADLVSSYLKQPAPNMQATYLELMLSMNEEAVPGNLQNEVNLLPFLAPLLQKSSEAYRNFAVIKRLRQSENLQVKDELYTKRKEAVKVTGDSMCSLCNKKIGTSVFAVYPDGSTLVHFVCFRDSQNMKAVRGTQPKNR